MYLLAIAAMAMSSTTGLPADRWNCRNQLEVWCAADGCAATPPDEFTPMDIHATAGAAGKASSLSVCAYSGCWESDAAPIRDHCDLCRIDCYRDPSVLQFSAVALGLCPMICAETPAGHSTHSARVPKERRKPCRVSAGRPAAVSSFSL